MLMANHKSPLSAGLRDGIEDYEYLYTLKEKADDALLLYKDARRFMYWANRHLDRVYKLRYWVAWFIEKFNNQNSAGGVPRLFLKGVLLCVYGRSCGFLLS